ncbi:MAG: Malonyl CoA-acyl carrier protein transacylase, partial [Ilumatobacteraceae bacterium]|nr:Malonyl CoA-acyl carrier protein transacylase [Ilumatobacteraceae bacterium]
MSVNIHRPSSVGEVLARRVEATPDARALVFPDEEVTYAQLWDRVAGTARGLEQLGVGPGQLVGVL